MKPMRTLIAFALAATGALPAACEDAVVIRRECQPESRAWVSGHYEWLGDDYAYVPGHWVVTPASCHEVIVEAPPRREVIYVERPTTRVVYVERPRCEERVVYAERPRCEERTVVVPPSCPPAHEHHAQVSVNVSAPLIPIPVPLPFPFPFRHHH